MVFSSIPFLFFFLPASLILYYAAPFKLKNHILLAFSLVFYAWGEPVYIILMLLRLRWITQTGVSWISLGRMTGGEGFFCVFP